MDVITPLKPGLGTLGLGLVLFGLGAWASLAERAPPSLRAIYGLRAPAALVAARTAVVLVDFQDEFVHGRLRLPQVREAIARAGELATWARRSGVQVVLVRNVIDRPDSPLFRRGSPTAAFVPELEPRTGDLVIEKSTGGALTRTGLDADLRARGIDTLIVGGLMTHLAVAITAADATMLGYHVVVAADATATRALAGTPRQADVEAATVQRAALAAIADRAADVMLAQTVMALPVSYRPTTVTGTVLP